VYIRSIATEGLRALTAFEAPDLGRVVRVSGTPPGRTALADALSIVLGSLTLEDCATTATQLGLGRGCEVRGETFPEEVVVQRPEVARCLVGQERTIRVRVELVLDPPQYGALRTHALRDPRLVRALGAEGATLGLAVGWVFTRDWTVAATSVLSVKVGGLDLPLVGDERPAWLWPFLAGLGGRLRRRAPGPPDPLALARAERSVDLEQREAARRVHQTVRGAPFRLGHLEVVDGETTWLGLRAGEDLLPLRSFGPRVEDAVGLIEAVHLSGGEILVVEAPLDLSERPRALLSWLRRQSEADGSALEQVWLIGVGGEGALEPG